MHDNANNNEAVEIQRLGLEYRLVTPYTSFVAVDESSTTREGQPVRVEVPVEMPDGVSHEGVFGNGSSGDSIMMMKRMTMPHMVGSTAESVVVDRAVTRAPVRELPPEVKDGSKLDARLAMILASNGGSNATATVEVWLSDATPQILSALQRLGFQQTVEPKVAKIRVGRIAVNKIQQMAAMPEVLAIRLAPLR